MSTCSIVIPVHNEAENIEELFLDFWEKAGDLRPRIVEVLLVENGSQDETFGECQKLEKALPGVVKAHHLAEPSYGDAVKLGMRNARGDITVILEGDLLDVSFLLKSFSLIEEKKIDFVVGSKRHPEARDQRPWQRRALTLFFNTVLKIFFRFPGTDTHGLKAIRTTAAKELCKKSLTGGEAFQTEIVLLAHKLGYRVEEAPLAIRERRRTKIHPLRRFPKILTIVKDIRRSLKRF